MKQLKTQRKPMKTSIKILSIILITLLISCQKEIRKQVYKTKDGKGYCYQDDNTLQWYLLTYNNSTNNYDVTPTSTTPSYDITTPETITIDISESTGQDVGGTDSNNDSSGNGMSESNGSDGGGSDGGGGGE